MPTETCKKQGLDAFFDIVLGIKVMTSSLREWDQDGYISGWCVAINGKCS